MPSQVVTFPITNFDYSQLLQMSSVGPSSQPTSFGFPDLPGLDPPDNGGPAFWTDPPPVGELYVPTYYGDTFAMAVGGAHDWSGHLDSDWYIRDGLFVTQGNGLDTGSLLSDFSQVTNMHLTVEYQIVTASARLTALSTIRFPLHQADQTWIGYKNARALTTPIYGGDWLYVDFGSYPYEEDLHLTEEFGSGDEPRYGRVVETTVDFMDSTVFDMFMAGNLGFTAYAPDALQQAGAPGANALVGMGVYTATLTIDYLDPTVISGQLLPGRAYIP